MDIQDLRYFIAVCDSGSYAKAADKMFVSRQALRQKLQRLEEEIGSPLFAYSNKKLEPTALGHTLYKESATLVNQFQSLELNLLAQSQQKKTELSIAIGHGVYSVIPHDIFLDFQQLHPQISLHFSRSTDTEMVSEVKSGKLDLGIVGAYTDLLEDLDAVRIQFSPRLHVHVSVDNPLCYKEELDMSDLQEQPFFSFDAQCHTCQFVKKECQTLGFEPDFRFYNLDYHSIRTIASRCAGLTWSFPPSRPEHKHPKFVTIPLKFSDPSWGTYIISRQGRKLSVPARLLVQYLCEHVQDV